MRPTQFKSLISQRLSSGWGMAGLWEKLRTGFGRNEAAINKIKQSEALKANSGQIQPKITESNTTNDNAVVINPWDMTTPKKKLGPPEQLWMQSQFVRGSTQKMTTLARQIIGLPLDAALLQMRFTPKKKGETVMQLLSSMKAAIMVKGGNPAYYYIKSATVGRGTYLKRLDIRARGKHGTQWRGHTFIRICCYKPDPKVLVHKLLRIRKIPREDRPIMKKIDYY